MAPFPEKLTAKEDPRRYNALQILQIIVFSSLILYFGKTLFIPLSFSLLVSFILYPVCKWMEKNGISKSYAIVLALTGITLLSFSIFYLLFSQLFEFLKEWQLLQEKVMNAIHELSLFITERFNISSSKQEEFVKSTMDSSGSEAFAILQSTAYSISNSFFTLFLIPIFAALILFNRELLANALYDIFPVYRKNTIHEILVETIHAYYDFIKGMLLVYFIVGILNSVGLLIIGVPHPFLFGFIASILTFIPYVGIMISSLLPIAVSWITYNSIWYPIGVIVVFTIVQILEAYIIFPFAVGSRLKINTLAIIVMILIGGILWGAAGMILFIPFISIVKLIADRTPSMRWLSILLGDGNPKSEPKNIIENLQK